MLNLIDYIFNMHDIKIVEPVVHSIPADEVSVNDWIVKDFDMPLMYMDFMNNIKKYKEYEPFKDKTICHINIKV